MTLGRQPTVSAIVANNYTPKHFEHLRKWTNFLEKQEMAKLVHAAEKILNKIFFRSFSNSLLSTY